jgi:Lar family restriction alleviation protein
MMKEIDLKPCPFCGKTECIKVLEQPIDVAGIEIVYIVYCTYCGGQIWSPKRKDAIMAWNRRADND